MLVLEWSYCITLLMNLYWVYILSVLLLLFNIHMCLLWQILWQIRAGTAQKWKEEGISRLAAPVLSIKWTSFGSDHVMKRQFQMKKEQTGKEGMQSEILHAAGLMVRISFPGRTLKSVRQMYGSQSSLNKEKRSLGQNRLPSSNLRNTVSFSLSINISFEPRSMQKVRLLISPANSRPVYKKKSSPLNPLIFTLILLLLHDVNAARELW